jgi:hypothetical protein
MAFPTTAQLYFRAIDQWMGQQDIMTSSTTQNHPLGTLLNGSDTGTLGYGPGVFIYLKGVASTAAGDLVVYDNKAATTTRTVAASRGPVAVAMSANVANQYGWYQVYGISPVSTTGTSVNGFLAVSATGGQAAAAGAAGQKVNGAITRAAQDTPSSGFTQTQLNWPYCDGGT